MSAAISARDAAIIARREAAEQAFLSRHDQSKHSHTRPQSAPSVVGPVPWRGAPPRAFPRGQKPTMAKPDRADNAESRWEISSFWAGVCACHAAVHSLLEEDCPCDGNP